MKNQPAELSPIVKKIGQKITITHKLYFPGYRKYLDMGTLRAKVTVTKIGRTKFTTSDGKVWDLLSGLLYKERSLTSIDRTWYVEL